MRTVTRAAAALLIAATLIVGLQIAGTGTASADSCWQAADGHVICVWDPVDVPGDDPSGGGGGGGGGGSRPRPIIGDPDPVPVETPDPGIEQVLPMTAALKVDAVLNGDCANLITGLVPAGGLSAMEVWRRVQLERSPSPAPLFPEVTLASVPIGASAMGPITFYPPFYTNEPDTVSRYLPDDTRLSRLPDADEFKALVILHELAHLTRSLPSDDGDKQFNLQILQKCFGITKVN